MGGILTGQVSRLEYGCLIREYVSPLEERCERKSSSSLKNYSSDLTIA